MRSSGAMRRRTEIGLAFPVVRQLAACGLALAALAAPVTLSAKPADLPSSLIDDHATDRLSKKKSKKAGKNSGDDEPAADGDAKKLALEAAKHEKKGRYDEARDAYRKALELDDAPKYRVRLAVVEAKLGNLVEAAEMLRDVEQSSKAGAAEKKNAQRERAAIEERIPKLELVLEPGFTGSVSVDGQELDSGSRKRPVTLNPGSHRVHAEASGFLGFDENVELNEGESKKLSVKLEPESESDETPAREQPVVAEQVSSGGSSSRPKKIAVRR